MADKKICKTCGNRFVRACDEPCLSCVGKSNYVPVAVDDQDNVNHPAHYECKTSIECIDAMELAFGVDAIICFCLGNAFKYIWRHKHKGGAEDLAKAKWYLDKIETYGDYVRDMYLPDMKSKYDKLCDMLEDAETAHEGL